MHQLHYLGVLWPQVQPRSSTGAWSKHKSVPEVTITPWPPGGCFHLRSSLFFYFYRNLNKLDYGCYLGNSVLKKKVPFKRQKKERKKKWQLWLIRTAPGPGTSIPCFGTSDLIKEASDQKLGWNIQLERHEENPRLSQSLRSPEWSLGLSLTFYVHSQEAPAPLLHHCCDRWSQT